MTMKILKLILDQGLTPNCFYILYCIRHGEDYEKFTKSYETQLLVMEDYMIEDVTREGKIIRTLLPKAISLLDKAKKLESPQKKKSNLDILGENYAEKIKEYIEVFPNIKLPHGKAARSDKKNIETGLAWFMSNYSYSWDIIMKATITYVDEYQRKNYLYMQTSQYFIRKQQADKSWGSELANKCSEIAAGTMSNNEDYFKEKVV